MNELLSLLEGIESSFGVRICVHDVSGITFSVRSLELPYLWKTHGADYCTQAKQYTTEEACMHQKEIALTLLRRNGVKPYCGVCRMGVCDYIEPVKIGGRLVAVVFASGFLKDRKESVAEKIRCTAARCCPENTEAMLATYRQASEKASVSCEQLKFFAQLIAELIKKEARELPQRILPEVDSYPVESVRVWRTEMSALLVTFLEENYKNKLSLKTLSQRFLISEGHVNRLVRNEVHMGAITYIRHLRMEEAARKLTTTDLPVHEISEYVGYTDTNYFCRVFKSIYGMTPSEYRTNRT